MVLKSKNEPDLLHDHIYVENEVMDAHSSLSRLYELLIKGKLKENY